MKLKTKGKYGRLFKVSSHAMVASKVKQVNESEKVLLPPPPPPPSPSIPCMLSALIIMDVVCGAFNLECPDGNARKVLVFLYSSLEKVLNRLIVHHA